MRIRQKTWMYLMAMILAVGVYAAEAGKKNINDMPVSPRAAKRALMNQTRSVQTKRDSAPLVCGQNALCDKLPGTFEYKYGQIGLYFLNEQWDNKKVFVRVYVYPTVPSGVTDEYMIPKWNGKGYFIKVNSTSPPLWIQPTFLDDLNDPECPGCREFVSATVMYKVKGMDYSTWPYGNSLAYVYFTVDANGQVKRDTNGKQIASVDVYEKDDETLMQEYRPLTIGDWIQMAYVEDDYEDTPGWGNMAMEQNTEITQEPEIIYAGMIPQRDFACTNCAFDIAQTDIAFRLQGWEKATSTDPVWSKPPQPLGKLIDSVCSEYPYSSTINPTLADIVEGLRIISALKPLHFCYRDVNNDGKFGLEELVWMLQKIAKLR